MWSLPAINKYKSIATQTKSQNYLQSIANNSGFLFEEDFISSNPSFYKFNRSEYILLRVVFDLLVKVTLLYQSIRLFFCCSDIFPL